MSGDGGFMDLMEVRRNMMGVIAQMAMSSRKMTLIATYTIENGWSNDTEGNASVAWESIMKPALEADATYSSGKANIFIGIVENNTNTTNYSFDYMVYYGVLSSLVPSPYFSTTRNDRTNISAGASTNRSLRVSAGTIVKIYRVFD